MCSECLILGTEIGTL